MSQGKQMGTVHDILKNQGKRGALEAEHARGPEAVQLSCEEAHRTAVTLARFSGTRKCIGRSQAALMLLPSRSPAIRG